MIYSSISKISSPEKNLLVIKMSGYQIDSYHFNSYQIVTFFTEKKLLVIKMSGYQIVSYHFDSYHFGSYQKSAHQGKL